MELAHRRRTGLGTRGESAGEIVATLRDEGFTHLLLCPPEPEDAVEFDPTLGRLLAPWLDRRGRRSTASGSSTPTASAAATRSMTRSTIRPRLAEARR